MARRGMPEVHFGFDVYLWDRHESVLATLRRTMVRANWPLWVVERVVSLSANPTNCLAKKKKKWSTNHWCARLSFLQAARVLAGKVF
jgi:hypothetical protein